MDGLADTCARTITTRVSVAFRRLSQTQWVIVTMILGVAVGVLFPDSRAAGPTGAQVSATAFHATDLEVLSNIFLWLSKSMIAPMFSMFRIASFVLPAGYTFIMEALAARTELHNAQPGFTQFG